MNERLVQYRDADGARRLGCVSSATAVQRVAMTDSIYGLVHRALAERKPLAELVAELRSETGDDYDSAMSEGRVLPPLDHPVDEARCLIWGRGCSFVGDGASLCAAGAALPLPYAVPVQAMLAVLYVIGPEAQPWRIGYALAHECGVMQPAGLGPELALELPADLHGETRVSRAGTDASQHWRVADDAGAEIARVEAKAFVRPQCRRPGDVHVHLVPVLSGSAPVALEAGDEVTSEARAFGRALVQPIARAEPEPVRVRTA